MGRAMLIICAGVLVSLGIVSISTSNQAKMLNQTTVNYAEYTMAKNAAHTAIQMATQKINKNEDWPNNHNSEESAWVTTIQGLEVRLHTDFVKGDVWEDLSGPLDDIEQDKLWFYSRAQLGEEFGDNYVEVRSHFEKRPFYDFVPDFTGALQLPSGYNTFNVDGNAHGINGIADHCPENRPPLTLSSSEYENGLPEDLNTDGDIVVDPTLSYEPTDELIERLANSGNAQTVTPSWDQPLGTPEEPGIFFIEGEVNLTGKQSEGYGIMVIRTDEAMKYDGELDVAGNFEFNGLVIFENAFKFDGRGTPTINGSVLIGNTDGQEGVMDIDLGGNININYDCNGETYAKMAADRAIQQSKYTLKVSTENMKYGQVSTP